MLHRVQSVIFGLLFACLRLFIGTIYVGLAGIIIVSVPIFFMLIWIIVGKVDLLKTINLANKGIERFFPEYEVKIGEISTSGIFIKPVGGVDFYLKNLSIKNKTDPDFLISVEELHLSSSLKKIITGNFIPMPRDAKKIYVSLNVDNIESKAADKKQRKEISKKIVKYISSLYSSIDKTKKEIAINDVAISLKSNGENFFDLKIDNSTTKALAKKRNFIDRTSSILSESYLSINDIKSSFIINCSKNDYGKNINCNFNIDDLAIGHILNNNLRSKNKVIKDLIFDFNGYIDFDTKNSSIKYVKVVTESQMPFAIIDTENDKILGVKSAAATMFAKDNLSDFQVDKISLSLKDGAVLEASNLSFFTRKVDKNRFFDGKFFIKSSEINFFDFIETFTILMESKKAKKITSYIENNFLIDDGYINLNGVVNWDTSKESDKFWYDINLKTSFNELHLLKFNDMVIHGKIDVDLTSGLIDIRSRGLSIFDSNFNDLNVRYSNAQNRILIKSDNESIKLGSLMGLIYHLSGKKYNKSIDDDVLVKNNLNVSIPITNEKKDLFNGIFIDLSARFDNYKNKYISLPGSDVLLAVKKKENESVFNSNLSFKKIVDKFNTDIIDDSCSIKWSTKVDVINKIYESKDMRSECENSQLIFEGGFVINPEKLTLSIDKFITQNNDFTVLLNANKNLYSIKFIGDKVNAGILLALMDFNDKNHKPDKNKIDVDKNHDSGIHTARMRNIVEIFSRFTNKRQNIANIPYIDFDLKIKTFAILNDYAISDLTGYFKMTKSSRIRSKINGSIGKINDKQTLFYLSILDYDKKGFLSKIDISLPSFASILKGIYLKDMSPFHKMSLKIDADVDNFGNINGNLLAKNIIYNKRKGNEKPTRISIGNIKTNFTYVEPNRIFELKNGEIWGAIIIGDFKGSIDLRSEMMSMKSRFALGKSRTGISDVPIIGNILTFSTSEKRYFASFLYRSKGYLYEGIKSDISPNSGITWLFGFWIMLFSNK